MGYLHMKKYIVNLPRDSGEIMGLGLQTTWKKLILKQIQKQVVLMNHKKFQKIVRGIMETRQCGIMETSNCATKF